MKLSIHTMTIESFVPMLESLGEWLDKAAPNHVDARLAPDMYTLAQQVQQACFHAEDATARLVGRAPAAVEDAPSTLSGLRARVERTLTHLRDVSAAAFDGAEDRDCSIPTPNKMVIEMDGVRFIRAWALPHFYFHIVTAYGILRHSGVALGKKDYLSQVGRFIKPAT